MADEAARQTHSTFLASLGGSADIRLSDDISLQLRHWDDWLYKTIVLLHPSAADFGGAVDVSTLLEFTDAGGNLLVALDSDVSEAQRELAQELGVDVEPSGTAVIDHFSHDAADVAHTTVLASGFLNSKAVFGEQQQLAPVRFKGIGLSVSPESKLAFAALSASPTAYSAKKTTPLRENPNLAGSNMGLAALVQPRSGGRVVVLGSVDALSDASFTAAVGDGKSGNAAFADAIVQWMLGRRGLLRFGDFVHSRVGETEPPATYTIKDQLQFSVQIQELVDSQWQPFKAEDVQLEYVMLDPHVRTTLQHDGQGTFSTAFQVPDVYGVFKFVIDYNRPGYNAIELSQQAPVRPFKHTEFDRFLVPAYPYYVSALTTMAAFAVIVPLFLYLQK